MVFYWLTGGIIALVGFGLFLLYLFLRQTSREEKVEPITNPEAYLKEAHGAISPYTENHPDVTDRGTEIEEDQQESDQATSEEPSQETALEEPPSKTNEFLSGEFPSTIIHQAQRENALPLKGEGQPSLPPQPSTEPESDQLKRLQVQMRLLNEKAVQQAKGALELIQQLRKENARLKDQLRDLQTESAHGIHSDREGKTDAPKDTEVSGQEIADLLTKEKLVAEETIQKMSSEIQELKSLLAQKTAQVSTLEEKMSFSKKLHEDLENSLSTSHHYKSENARLLIRIEELSNQQRQWEESLERGQKEIEALRGQEKLFMEQGKEFDGIKTQLRDKEEQISRLQKELASDERIQVYELKCRNLEQQLVHFTDSLDNLHLEKESLLEVKSHLERDLKKTRELNAHLLDKERMLQYELTKARAQAIGLEKISADFKTEMDEIIRSLEVLKKENTSMLKAISEREEEYKNLKQQKVLLETREQLTQHELLKSQQQLSELQKFYAEFKARLEGGTRPPEKDYL